MLYRHFFYLEVAISDQMVAVELPLQAEMDRLEQLILKLLSEADDSWDTLDTLWQINIAMEHYHSKRSFTYGK